MKLKEVRLTKEYQDLQDILWYLRYNYKTRTSTTLYREQVKHDLRKTYNAWKKDVVALMRQDKMDEARTEIKRVSVVRNLNKSHFERERIIWDLLHKYDDYFYFLRKRA